MINGSMSMAQVGERGGGGGAEGISSDEDEEQQNGDDDDDDGPGKPRLDRYYTSFVSDI